MWSIYVNVYNFGTKKLNIFFNFPPAAECSEGVLNGYYGNNFRHEERHVISLQAVIKTK
jgi:hypothetical protein